MFNRARIDDRQVNELLGMAKMITADGIVSQDEAEYLQKWLVANQAISSNPVVTRLMQRVEAMLRDNVLDADEAEELFDTLHRFTGGDFELGELTKASRLPIDNPVPEIRFTGCQYVFTGTFAFGPRRECEQAVGERGGSAGRLSRGTDYLVIGVYATDSWAHSAFGRKIEQALDMREKGYGLAIVSEEDWVAKL